MLLNTRAGYSMKCKMFNMADISRYTYGKIYSQHKRYVIKTVYKLCIYRIYIYILCVYKLGRYTVCIRYTMYLYSSYVFVYYYSIVLTSRVPTKLYRVFFVTPSGLISLNTYLLSA